MSLIHISKDAYPEVLEALRDEGHQIALEGPKQAVSEAIAAHPDILLCKLGAAPESPVFRGNESLLGPVYPADVPYNAVVTERFMICNTKTVSADLLSAAKELYPDIRIIHVLQGYTKCNVVVVDESHFITEDAGIYNAIEAFAECLLIEPGAVLLPGFKRGFIGGTSGRIGDEIWFNGDISLHPDWAGIKSFIEGWGLGIRFVPGRSLMDIGSIIEEAL